MFIPFFSCVHWDHMQNFASTEILIFWLFVKQMWYQGSLRVIPKSFASMVVVIYPFFLLNFISFRHPFITSSDDYSPILITLSFRYPKLTNKYDNCHKTSTQKSDIIYLGIIFFSYAQSCIEKNMTPTTSIIKAQSKNQEQVNHCTYSC